MRPGGVSLRPILLQQAGRIAGYSFAGLLFGWLGTTLPTDALPMLGQAMRIASGVTIVLMALQILSGWNLFRTLERVGARFWTMIRPAMRYAVQHRNGTAGLLLTGLLWGWMPCGLVYSMLTLAVFGGRAATGAGIMMAFGIGTLPSVLASSYLLARVPQGLKRWSPRYVQGLAMAGFGIWLCVSAFPGSHPAHHHDALAGTAQMQDNGAGHHHDSM